MKIEFALKVQQIPKEKIWVSKQGVKYLTVVVTEKREPDQYGNTHSIYVKPSKEDFEQGKKTVYIGDGRVRDESNTYQQQNGQHNTQQQAQTYTPPPPPATPASNAPASKPEDDLPF